MKYFKLIALSGLAGLLLSRGGVESPSWILVLIGLGLWVQQLNVLSLKDSLYFTAIFWFIGSFFLLDWLKVLGADAKIALCVFVTLYWTFVVWIWNKFFRSQSKYQSLMFALLFVASEYVLSVAPFGGFNWLRLGYLLPDLPTFRVSYWFGISAITFLAMFFLHRITKAELSKIKTFSLIFLIAFVSSLTHFLTGIGEDERSDSGINVLGIQGSVPQVGLDFNAQRAAVFANHYRKTQSELMKSTENNQKIDLVVWPENSSDIDPFRNSDISRALIGLEQKYGIPILFGAVLEQDDGLGNAAVLVKDGVLKVEYQKQKLVPFGEYLPFRSLLAPLIERFDRLSRDFIPGQGSNTILVNSLGVSVLICYEVAFDQIWHQAAKRADVLVVMTNNATYGGTTQPMQQLRITQAHARSLQIPIMVVATSGTTAFINKDGQIVEIISDNIPAAIYQNIAKPSRVAPAAYTAIPLQILSLLTILISIIRRTWINYFLKRKERYPHHL
jgi:apolipoprotein N-acyltransferase